MVTSCHGTDLRQFLLCPHLQEKVISGCQKIEKILALTQDQKEKIISTFNIPYQRVEVIGAGFDNTIFSYKKPKKKPAPFQRPAFKKTLLNMNLDASVAIATFCSFVGSHRLGLASSSRADAIWRNPVIHEVVHHRIGAAIGNT